MREPGPVPPRLSVEGLTVQFRHPAGWVDVVRDVSFEVPAGRIVGLVGESGSGKSVTAMAAQGLVQSRGGRVAAGTVRLDGRDVTHLKERDWSRVRGRQTGMIFQDPARSLNPAYTVGEQIAETLRRHLGLSRRQAWDEAVQMLERVHIPDAARRARDYPHAFSGGMAQRAMIAMALACRPQLFVADEPTTALDATVQKKILDLLRSVNEETGAAILLITHDLTVVAELCDEVVVMYAGEVVETGAVTEVFTRPRHPYTQGLLDSLPQPGRSLRAIPGQLPHPGDELAGCRFAPRCAEVQEGRCDVVPVALTREPDVAGERPAVAGSRVRCLRHGELHLAGIEGTSR